MKFVIKKRKAVRTLIWDWCKKICTGVKYMKVSTNACTGDEKDTAGAPTHRCVHVCSRCMHMAGTIKVKEGS